MWLAIVLSSWARLAKSNYKPSKNDLQNLTCSSSENGENNCQNTNKETQQTNRNEPLTAFVLDNIRECRVLDWTRGLDLYKYPNKSMKANLMLCSFYVIPENSQFLMRIKLEKLRELYVCVCV